MERSTLGLDDVSEAIAQMTHHTTITSLEKGDSLHPASDNSDRLVFRLYRSTLTRRCRGDRSRIPCRNLCTDQLFAVDDVGVYWMGHHRQEQTFGGDRHVVPLEQGDEDEDSWNEFVNAIRRTRVGRAMRALRRDDLRTAMWLSRKAHNGEYRFLQFSENHPELAAQILPRPEEGSKWGSQPFQKAWRLVAT